MHWYRSFLLGAIALYLEDFSVALKAHQRAIAIRFNIYHRRQKEVSDTPEQRQ